MTAIPSPAKTGCRIGLLAAALLLSACSILPKAETLTVYQLPVAPLASQASTAGKLPVSLHISTPYSSQVIDSTRILVMPRGSQISAYSGVRWSDPAPTLLRNRLVDAFRSDGRIASVSLGGGSLGTDFKLTGDLMAFQVVYESGAPVVHIHYDASLVQSAANRSIATHRFDVSQTVQGKETPQVVKAFGLAADQLAAQIIEWTLQQTQAATLNKKR